MSNILGLYTPEAIAFQDTSFLEQLADIFAAHRSDPEVDQDELGTKLEVAIKKRMGLNIDIVFSDFGFYCMMPELDRNNPLMKDYFDQHLQSSKASISAIRKAGDKTLKASVDLQAARVYGWFADMAPVEIGISPNEIFNTGHKFEMSPKELAASLLHELGHLFVFLEFFVRTRTTNQILAAAVRELDETTDFEKRSLVIHEAGTALGVKLDLDADELSNKKTETIYTVMISSYKRAIVSQNPLAGYDITTAEALADQFSQRFGAGVYLVTTLDKLFRQYGSIGSRSTAAYVVMESVKVLIGVGGFLATIAGIVPAFLVIYGMYLPLWAMIMSDSYDPRYDKPGARFKRIRDQIVAQLKDTKLPRQVQLKLQGDLKTIDDIVERTKDHVQLLGLVYDYLSPSGISKRKSIEFQQGLETMSNNNLFAAASKLRTGTA